MELDWGREDGGRKGRKGGSECQTGQSQKRLRQFTVANSLLLSCHGQLAMANSAISSISPQPTRCQDNPRRITQRDVIRHCFFYIISISVNGNNVKETAADNIYRIDLSHIELFYRKLSHRKLATVNCQQRDGHSEIIALG